MGRGCTRSIADVENGWRGRMVVIIRYRRILAGLWAKPPPIMRRYPAESIIRYTTLCCL